MGGYLDANGVHTYFEVAGDGENVVLLHGGLATAESWSGQFPALAEKYRVYVPERRAHGRTPDVDGPITYQLMADDTAAFLDTLGEGPAHLIGWSDGAVVAALLAMQRPDLVKTIVLIGQYFTLDGMTPECAAMFRHVDHLEPFFRPQYDKVSPDGPGHFPVVFAKMRRLWLAEPDIPLADLAGIRAPALIMQGDGDMVDLAHSAAVHRAIRGSRLAVVPGATHGAPIEKPDLVNHLILDFLGGADSGADRPGDGVGGGGA